MLSVLVSQYRSFRCVQKSFVFNTTEECIEFFDTICTSYRNYSKRHPGNCLIMEKQLYSFVFVETRGFISDLNQIVFIYICNLPDVEKDQNVQFDLPRNALCLSTDTAYSVCTTIFNFKKQEYHTERVIVQGAGIFIYLKKYTPVKNALPGAWIANKGLIVDADLSKPFEHEIFFITLQPIKKNFSKPLDDYLF